MATINDPGPSTGSGCGNASKNGGRRGGTTSSCIGSTVHLFLLGALTWLATCVLLPPVAGFNVDTVNYIVHEGSSNSMFGFSVVLHQEQQRSWVIVGAPTADTSAYQEGVVNGGAVYRCDISDDNRCNLIPFDAKGNSFNDKNEQVDTKSNQWFGATVASAGINGPLVACAPRYVFHQLQPRKVERVEPVGTCYIARNNMQQFDEYSPCRTMYWGYHRQGSCQAGFSASLTKTGDRVFVGAPGSYYWQGQIYSFSLNNPKDKVYSTGESNSSEDDSYLGYSSATGDFTGDGGLGVAVGMPRGGGLLGKVRLFTWNMTNLLNITGEQIGAYFGYSIAVVDVDGDKLDDLIVGAPMHTEANTEGKYEMGRVYIIYQGKYEKFRSVHTRDGVNSKARFGLSVCSLGDINLDGFGDFAVGAPYDGPFGRGAVYVYHGSRNGPLEKPSQVIMAEDIVGAGRVSTFGFSVAGGIDLDGNQYPDMVVGAYDADKALVFKTRPVAVMNASTIFETDNKLISLEDKNCTLRDRRQVPCTVVNSCLMYNGINVPATLDIEVSWVLDSKKARNGRLFFLNDEGRNIRNQSMRLYRGKLECKSERVYLEENIRDKITPLEVEMKYALRQSSASHQRRRRAPVEPVLDQNRGTVRKDSINIQKNCGSDNVCIPDLSLQVNMVDKYLLGSGTLLGVDVLISNFEEDAFEAGFYMTIPAGLHFRRVERIGEIKDTPVFCSTPTGPNNATLKCDIGNPLPSNKVVNFRVLLATAVEVGMAPSYDFYMEANSTNPEAEGRTQDNIYRKSVGITVETELSIAGASKPPSFFYNYSEFRSINESKTEQHLGPAVIHIYEIRNLGPSVIEEAEFYLLWPHKTLGGDPLMYLVVQPEASGNIKCYPSTFVNPLNLEVESPRESFLKKIVAHSADYDSGARSEYHTSVSRTGSAGHSSSHSSNSSSSSSSRSGSSYSHSSSASSSQSGATQGHQHHHHQQQATLSESERRRLDAEENQESTGDASYVHRERAQYAANAARQRHGGVTAGGGSSGGSSREYSYSSSWNSSSVGGGPAITYSSSQNRTVYRGQDGRVRVTESSTEHYGKSSELFSGPGVDGETVHKEDFSDLYRKEEGSSRVSSSAGSYRVGGGNYREGTSGSSTSRGSSSSSSSSSSTAHQGSSSSGYSTGSRQGSSSSSGYSTGSSSSGGYAGGIYKSESSRTDDVSQDISDLSSRTHAAIQGRRGEISVSGGGSSTDTRRRMMSQQDGEPPRPDLITGVSAIEKLAQGRGGFQSATFDLGTLNRQNVDDEVRRGSSSSSSSSSGGRYSGGSSGSAHESYGSQSGGGRYGQQYGETAHSSSSSSGGKTYSSSSSHSSSGSSYSQHGGSQGYHSQHQEGATYGAALNEDEGDEYSEEYDEDGTDGYLDQHDNQGGYGSSYQQHSRTQLNQGHDNVDQRFKHYHHFERRQRRNVEADEQNERELEDALQCRATQCAIVRCVAGPLRKNEVAFIGLRGRMVAHTLHKISPGLPIKFSTMNIARVTKLPYIGQPTHMPLKTSEIMVMAEPEPTPKPDVVPLWIVVLAACAGTIILLLLVYLLAKFGFFKRNRPSESQERQPLNRNGNYHGDEHL